MTRNGFNTWEEIDRTVTGWCMQFSFLTSRAPLFDVGHHLDFRFNGGYVRVLCGELWCLCPTQMPKLTDNVGCLFDASISKIYSYVSPLIFGSETFQWCVFSVRN